MSNVLDYIINISGNATKVTYDIQKELHKTSEAFREASKSASAMGRTTNSLNDVGRSYGELRARVERYKIARDDSFRTDHIRRYNQMIERTEQQMAILTRQTETCANKAGRVGTIWSKFGGKGVLNVVGITGGLYALGSAIKSFSEASVQASAQVEKYSVTLRTMLGSQEEARDRMTEYQDVAKVTPFQFNEVVDAGNKLQAIGKYSRDNLTMLGDLAAAAGKPIDQVMGAYSKLATGQKGEGVNMFRDLLISTNDWVEATGKGVSKNGELMATTEEMLAALPKLMQSKGFLGMMAQQANTTEGRISNLKDSVFALQVSVGDMLKPSVDSVVGAMSSWVNSINSWIQIPTAQKIAEEKAKLNALVEAITDANTHEDTRLDLMTQLKNEYPEFLKGIDAETIKNDALLGKLKEVNKEYESKIRLAGLSDYANEEKEKLNELRSNLSKLAVAKGTKEAIHRAEIILSEAGAKTIYNKEGTRVQTFDKSADAMYKQKQGKTDIKSVQYVQAYNERKANLKIQKDNASLFERFNIPGYYEDAMDAYKKQLGFVNMIDEQYDQSAEAEGVDLKDKAKDKTTTLTPITPPSTSREASTVEQSIDTITGGGRNVKNITISIDKLIETVNNEFKNGEGVSESNDFMEKLTNALQMVVNDVNYS